MDVLLVLTYAAACVVIFKVFRIHVSAITLLTAVPGGIFLIGFILLSMNYNHPFSSQGRFYFNTTPISPLVNGRVIEAPRRAGDRVRKGDILFPLDPTHFQSVVDNTKAQLAAAKQAARELSAGRETAEAEAAEAEAAEAEAAEAEAAEAQAEMDRAQQAWERVAGLRPGVVSRQEIDNKHSHFLSAQSAIEAGEARLKAELADAEFHLEQTTVRAPTDGMVAQSFLREGMMAVQLPLKPVMVFDHDEPATFAAAFLQNSAQRLTPGNAAEVAFPAVPGRILHAKVKRVQNAIAQGQLQPTGALEAPESIQGNGRIMVAFEFTEPGELAKYQLVPGTIGVAAVYSEHLRESAVIRKVLLCMKSWTNYLFSDGH